MYKKSIRYLDDEGNHKIDDFYFNFSIAEIIEMEFVDQVSLSEILKGIGATKDPKVVINSMKYIILKSYCERSDDGVSFNKSKELSDAFEQTNAFKELHFELCTDAIAAAEFVNSVVPEIP